jgi:hypothetical protein
MEIKTEFLDEYTNKIDKLLKHSTNQNIIIYGLIIPILLLIFGFVASFVLK